MVSSELPTRRDYFEVLAAGIPADALVVTCLGNSSYLWATVNDRPENFYFEDAMGLALPFALGLASVQPERQVIVVEGDGGLLMHMGALASVGAVSPDNLIIILMQNGVHAASGGQPLTNQELDLAALAQSLGLDLARTVTSTSKFEVALEEALNRKGPEFIAAKLEPDLQMVRPPQPFNPIVTKSRFSLAIGAPRYIPAIFGVGGLEPKG
ncbi:MAG: thiamine pyrophosphate-dependent enzyme [Gammaproteobacteria bacterium]|nr:thiamine pyrophosphate-dependent enzyme [Gammaproteobacteria bacterium]